ncbi:MAG TPA: JAB domain-containing protein [Thermoanaerobaculia bacterium]|nr:JAB domain-containing protein [Thermoanaerobaculia bacterium]
MAWQLPHREGCLANAASILHSHPSGDPSPSAEYLAFTRPMTEAGEIVGRVLDHIVVGEAPAFVSLKQRGGS